MRRLGAYEYRRGWMKCDCPYCGRHKFGIHISHNRTHCFRCEATPSPIFLVSELEGLSQLRDAWKVVEGLEGVAFTEHASDLVKKTLKPLNLPDSYTLINMGQGMKARLAQNYMRMRGFDLDELALRGVGYCREGDKAGHIIFPFYQSGEVVYYHARNYSMPGPRYNNPSAEEDAVGKSHFIYNLDSLLIFDEITILEGVINCLTLGDDSIAGGGKIFSRYQLNLLIKSPCPTFNVALDKDAINEAYDLAIKLSKANKRVRLIAFPDARDTNDLGEEKTRELIEATPFKTYGKLVRESKYYA